jgi:hypothetical protein
VRRVESLFALADRIEARVAAAQRQAWPDEALRRRLDALTTPPKPRMANSMKPWVLCARANARAGSTARRPGPQLRQKPERRVWVGT